MKTTALSPELLGLIDGYWRAANYLSVGQIYLRDNPLLKRPLVLADVKRLLLGHWGTTPGQNFIYAHLNRVIRKYDLDMIFVSGPGHGGPAVVSNTYLEGTYSEIYPEISRDEDGTIYVRDASRVRADFASVLRFIEDMSRKWLPVSIGIEQVQYQAAVVQELLRRTKLPVRGIRPDRDKVTRFAPLEARYEQGQVVHCLGLPSWYEDELLSFPVGRHDDGVDALAYAWITCKPRASWGAV